MKRRALLFSLLLAPFVVWAVIEWSVRTQETLERSVAAPSGGQFILAGDVVLHVTEYGPPNAPVVLFTHGMGAWGGLWGPVLRDSCREVRCIAVDMPPFGFSSRPADMSYSREDSARRLWALADALGAQQVSIVGHSFGGRAAAEAALQQPERVSRLVLLAPALGLGEPASASGGLAPRLLSVPAIGRIIVAATLANPLLLRRGLGWFMADPNGATQEMADVLRAPLRAKGYVDGLGGWLPLFLFAPEGGLSLQPDAYARLTMPTLLIWGDKDRTTPLVQGEALATLVPGVRLEVLPGIGHMPQLEATGRVQALLAEHLASIR